MKVLILGAWPIGLVTSLSTHAHGSPKVVIADISKERLQVANNLSTNVTVQLSTSETVNDFQNVDF